MESKICTYTANAVRLQMVRVKVGINSYIDIRFNRTLLVRFPASQALDAAHRFSHYVSRLCIDRDLSCMLNLP